MSGPIVFHAEILSLAQKQVLPRMAEALAGSGFYLAGGTGLALQVGHRPSVDFDWFISKLGEPEALFNRLRRFNVQYEIASISLETVYVTTGGVMMSFIGYDYPLLEPNIIWPEHGISLASLVDIACMKLSAVASRGSRKDFIDLHYLITHFKPLPEYLSLFKKKYGNRDIGHVIRSLIYFADAESEPDIRIATPILWDVLKTDFERWVEELPPH